MKKLLTAILILALSALPLGCAGAEAADSPIERMLSDWTAVAYTQDDIFSQQNFALELILAFHQDPTWDNLVRARAAASFTCELMDYYAQHELAASASADDYAQLISQGLDVADVQATVNAYASEQSAQQRELDARTWQIYYVPELMECAYTADWVSALALNASARATHNDLELQYWFLTNNFLVLQLPQADADKLAEWSRQNLPAIMRRYPELFGSENELLNELNETLELMAENMLVFNSALAMTQADLNEFDAEAVASDVLEIAGLPRVLPLPASQGLELSDVTYYWTDADGNITPLERLMAFDELPNCMNMQYTGCTIEGFQAYVLELAHYGAELAAAGDTVASFDVDGVELLVWVDESAQTLDIHVSGGQICLAPNCYVEALSVSADQK